MYRSKVSQSPGTQQDLFPNLLDIHGRDHHSRDRKPCLGPRRCMIVTPVSESKGGYFTPTILIGGTSQQLSQLRLLRLGTTCSQAQVPGRRPSGTRTGLGVSGGDGVPDRQESLVCVVDWYRLPGPRPTRSLEWNRNSSGVQPSTLLTPHLGRLRFYLVYDVVQRVREILKF